MTFLSPSMTRLSPALKLPTWGHTPCPTGHAATTSAAYDRGGGSVCVCIFHGGAFWGEGLPYLGGGASFPPPQKRGKVLVPGNRDPRQYTFSLVRSLYNAV